PVVSLLPLHDALPIFLDRRAMMRVQASASGEVVQLTRDQMHALIQDDVEIGELIMKALIARRIELVAQGIGDVLLIGSAEAPATDRKSTRLNSSHVKN